MQRVNRYKRDRVMTPGRWILLTVIVIVVLLVSFNVYYRYLQSPIWSEEQSAEDNALKLGVLKKATDSYRYAWDEPVWVVKGTNADGADTYVWLKKDSSITLQAKDGLTEKDIKAQFQQVKADATIDHIRLGLFGGEPVWEVYYARNQAGFVSHFYDFYRFRDGSLIVMYKLPSQ